MTAADAAGKAIAGPMHRQERAGNVSDIDKGTGPNPVLAGGVPILVEGALQNSHEGRPSRPHPDEHATVLVGRIIAFQRYIAAIQLSANSHAAQGAARSQFKPAKTNSCHMKMLETAQPR